MHLKITPLLTGILFDDPAGWFLSFVEGSTFYDVEAPASMCSMTDEIPALMRSGLQLVMPLLLGAKPELLSQPASAMATWVLTLQADIDDAITLWAASFERGSLEGIKIREIDEAFKAQLVSAELHTADPHDFLKAMATEPLVWFPL